MNLSVKTMTISALVGAIAALSIFAGFTFTTAARAADPAQAIRQSTNPVDVHQYLVEFHNDPRRVMNTPLVKLNADGSVVTEPTSPLETAEASKEEIFKVRDQVREKMCGGYCPGMPESESSSLWALPNERNQISLFLDPPYLNRLVDMENQNLLKGVVEVTPWADSFWPQNKGMIARRWNDGVTKTSDWTANYQHFLNVPPWATDAKSASEKYDLLVGDDGWRLTNSQWDAGKANMMSQGRVPGWAGLCHGWAAAAIMSPNPKQSVRVTAANGQEVTFYPSDIKALASLAWGEARPLPRQVGERCKINDPQEDPVGRVREDKCMDVNPATWHMAMVNKIGIQKKAFIFDATYDYQVWNYPLYGYSYEYFNPQTLKAKATLAEAVVRRSDFTIDKFKEYRSDMTKYVVGISMDVSYVIPTGPSRRAFQTTAKEIKTVRYLYDLELDAEGNLLGGEWYSNFHPDFIQTFEDGDRTLSEGEKNLIQKEGAITWDGQFPLPENLRAAARVSSVQQEPLAVVVERLLQLSQGGGAAAAP